MKGFATTIIMLAVFASAIILLSTTTITPRQAQIKENFVADKIVIESYSLIINQSAQDCDWALAETVVKQCIDTKAQEALTKINTINAPYTNCQVGGAIKRTNSYVISLACVTDINAQGTIYQNVYSKQITIKKY